MEFLGRDWPQSHVDAIEGLFRDYIRAGMMPLESPINQMARDGSYVHAPSALEFAVMQGKTRAMVALIEEGADFTAVPNESLVRVAGSPVLAEPGALLDFIRHQTHTDVDGMLAAAKKVVMERRIDEAAITPGAGASNPPAARRLRARL